MVRMRAVICIIGWLVISVCQPGQAQGIPPFRMQRTDGHLFTAQDLPKSKPVLIIYFAPDCEHCQKLIHEVLARSNDFKKVQMMLISFEPISMVITFEKAYHLSQYSNIMCGTETPTFYFKDLFHLTKTPFTALYDKKGRLMISYQNETPVADLVRYVAKL